MTCSDLAARIQELQPEATLADVARLCLLLANGTGNPEALGAEDLAKTCRDVRIRLEATTDQHAAMISELECLSREFSGTFTLDNVLTLVRAFKVQSQMLRLYVGNRRWMLGSLPEKPTGGI